METPSIPVTKSNQSNSAFPKNESLSVAPKESEQKAPMMAQDASDNTKKMFRNMTDFYQVPMYEYSDKEMLGHFIGKEFRASLAVTNEGLSHSIEERLKQQSQLNNGRN